MTFDEAFFLLHGTLSDKSHPCIKHFAPDNLYSSSQMSIVVFTTSTVFEKRTQKPGYHFPRVPLSKRQMPIQEIT